MTVIKILLSVWIVVLILYVIKIIKAIKEDK